MSSYLLMILDFLVKTAEEDDNVFHLKVVCLVGFQETNNFDETGSEAGADGGSVQKLPVLGDLQ